jgi:hypothetical protein
MPRRFPTSNNAIKVYDDAISGDIGLSPAQNENKQIRDRMLPARLKTIRDDT